jgi:hypothetical protein
MINLDEKKYYIYGGFGLAIVLLLITLFSFFSVPKYEVSTTSNIPTSDTNTTGNGETTKVYSKPQVESVADVSSEENYSIKLTKPSGLPTAVQEAIDNDFSKKKLAFIKKYSAKPSSILENNQPQIYQSGKYISIVSVFLEYNGSDLESKDSLCWTYDQDTKAIVSLPQILESDDKAYTYLSATLKPLVLSSLAGRSDVVNSQIDGLNTKIGNVLTADVKNYSKWYLDGDQLIFMFSTSLFLDVKASEEKITLGFSESKNNLKSQAN